MTEQAGLPPFLNTYPHPALLIRNGLVLGGNPAAGRLTGLPASGEAPDELKDAARADGPVIVSCTLAGHLWEASASPWEGGALVLLHPAAALSVPGAAGTLSLLLDQIRQHVNNLSAATQLLTPDLRETGGRKAEQCLAIMNHSYYRLMRLLNELECARNLSGDSPVFRPAALDLAVFCRELADQVAPLAAQAGAAFRYESGLNTLLTVADGALLKRLLLALISNALRAAGEGGEAGLRLAKNGGRALLTVWDNGPGLASGALDGTDGNAYRQGSGLGLGLDIARRLAALHGGAVMLESRSGGGVRATLSLPLRAQEGAGAVRTPVPYDPAGGFSPVLVELSDLLPYQAFSPDDLD